MWCIRRYDDWFFNGFQYDRCRHRMMPNWCENQMMFYKQDEYDDVLDVVEHLEKNRFICEPVQFEFKS